jgi:hypothetical protein
MFTEVTIDALDSRNGNLGGQVWTSFAGKKMKGITVLKL